MFHSSPQAPGGSIVKFLFLLDVVIRIFISNSPVIDIHLLHTLLLQILNVTVKFKTAWKACSLFSYWSVVVHWFGDFLLLGVVEPADICSNSSLRCLIKVIRSHRWISSLAVNCLCLNSCSNAHSSPRTIPVMQYWTINGSTFPLLFLFIYCPLGGEGELSDCLKCPSTFKSIG